MNGLSSTPVSCLIDLTSCRCEHLNRPREKKTIAFFALALGLAFFWLIPHSASAAADDRAVLPGHLASQAVRRLTATGTLDPKRELRLDLVLPLRNQADLDDLTHRLYDPADPLYGHYLTPAEFTERFGPALSDVSAVVAFAKAHGLTVISISDNHAAVRVRGPVSAINAAFGVTLQSYTGKDDTDFYGPDANPTVPIGLSGKLLAVIGLNNLGKPQSFSHRVHPPASSPDALPSFARSLIGPSYSGNAGLSPTDVRTIYNLSNVTSQGTGQTLGLYELDTYTPSDIAAYESEYNAANPAVPLQNVGVDDFDTTAFPGGAAAEVTLDIEMYLALAPKASKIVVYEGNGNQDFETVNVEIFDKIATDDAASVVSVSYGLSEIDVTQAGAQAVNQTLLQLALQGQTVCIASGDAGAYTDQSLYPNDQPNTSEPGSQPLVLSIGGTDLTDSASAPHTYASETSWADSSDTGRGNNGTGGGGGVSEYWTIPSYQTGSFTTTANPQGSLAMRNVPDVSLYGDYDTGGYDIYFTDPYTGHGWYSYNGTSAASPLWAAFLADVNQARIAAGQPKLGLANTAIYTIAKQSSKYATDFHDIRDGSTNLFYNTVAGYDNATGWGSFNGAGLFNDLVSYSASADVTVQTLSFSPNPVSANGTTTGTITLSSPAPTGGATVVIAQTGTTSQMITVPAGATVATFQRTAGSSATTATVSATYNDSTASTLLYVTAATALPTITSFSPASAYPGAIVTATGTGFVGVTQVTLNGQAVLFSVLTSTSLEFIIPTGASSGTVGVSNSAGTIQSAGIFTVLSSGPAVTSFSPTSGAPGTIVTVTGTGFAGAVQVTLNGQSVGFSSVTGTSLTFTVPSSAATGKIGVVTLTGTGQSSTSFTVTGAIVPTVTGFAPTSGPPGTSVTVTGTGFTSVSQVTLNGASVVFSLASATSLSFTVPSGASSGKIAVTTPSGTGQSSTSFTVTLPPPPTITGFTPTSGPPGTPVMVTGTGFTGATQATLNGASVVFSLASVTSLSFTVPSGATSGKIAVTTPSGTGQSSGSFTVTRPSPPTITGISPATGSAGTTITITGTNLSSVTQVTIDGVSVTFTVVNSTTITFVVPAGVGSGKITVTSPGGSATSAATFTIATWNAVDVSASGDGTSRVLWRRSDGAAGVWTLSSADDQTAVGPTYGPYGDSGGSWTARKLAAAPNGTSRLLWTRSDGAIGVWNLDANDTAINTGVVYGPISGWTAVDVAAASDGTARVLWTNTTGAAGVWTLNAAGTQTAVGPTYGPYTSGGASWTAVAIGVAGGGTSRLLWSRGDGAMGVWSLDAHGNQASVGPTYGPYTGWKVADLGTSADGTSDVLWKRSDGAAVVWAFSQDVNSAIGTTYGPISDSHGTWSANALGAANDVSHVLWVRSDRVAGVWSLNSQGVQTVVGTIYGPY